MGRMPNKQYMTKRKMNVQMTTKNIKSLNDYKMPNNYDMI